ncbi:MAG: FAD/NAD(P)-binding protein [Pirellula sp.]|jgi:NAD(P)H-flavin reductase|nr:FAD/NAD(P)-binding protein [Pirellula sp.]
MSIVPAIEPSVQNFWRSHFAIIEEVRSETADVSTYRIRFQDDAIANKYRFQPGQFNMLYVPRCGESAISLSGGTDGNDMLHTIRFVGRVTNAIANLKTGDAIGVRGPFGVGWPVDACRGGNVILISGGLGLAPLRPMICEFTSNRSRYESITLLHGSRAPDQILFEDEFSEWRRHGIAIQLTVDRADDHWEETVGVVTSLLDRMPINDPSNTRVLICGPEIMMHYCALGSVQKGISEQSIWLSMERHMQCAAGLCGHCQWGETFVCRDGPVFRFDTIRHLFRSRDL